MSIDGIFQSEDLMSDNLSGLYQQSLEDDFMGKLFPGDSLVLRDVKASPDVLDDLLGSNPVSGNCLNSLT